MVGKTGVLVSCTRVVNPPAGFGSRPFWVGVARFGSKKLVTAPLVVEGVKPEAGKKVVGIIRRLGEAGPEDHLIYGLKFKVK